MAVKGLGLRAEKRWVFVVRAANLARHGEGREPAGKAPRRTSTRW
jgi:hypothetical protein